MNKFKLTIDGSSVRKLTTDILHEAVLNMKDNSESFIILEPKNPIDNSIYIQAIRQENSYMAEIRFIFGSPDNFKHYSKLFDNRETLFETLLLYYQQQQIPNIKTWIDETKLSNDEVVEDDEMIKLYKRDDQKILYFEAWINDEISLTIHTGIVGDTGFTEDVFYDEEGDLPVKVALSQLASKQQELGFKPIALTELIVQYKYDNSSKRHDTIIRQKDNLESLLNECLGWTGNGHCEGGDAEMGLANLFCYVIDREIAVRTILETLEDDVPNDLRIAYADEKTEEFLLLYPNQGTFDLI